MKNTQRNLFIWGKGYSKPSLVSNKVIQVSSGENHFIFKTLSKDIYAVGSNRYGQLGLKQPQYHQQPTKILSDLQVQSIYCGAEHTFIITEKHQIYSMGLNVKGQLGHSHFQNSFLPKLVTTLLPFGGKNSKNIPQNDLKWPKSPVIQILEKFDLQVKVDDPTVKTFILNSDQFIMQISCGALFTIALSNKGRIFITGSLGSNKNLTIDQQIQKTRFAQVVFDVNISKINAGLSGAILIDSKDQAYIWGRFGSICHNLPKKIVKQQRVNQKNNLDGFIQGKIGDQFCMLITMRGQIWALGQNIQNQLGCQSHKLIFQQNCGPIQKLPLANRIFVGRNSVFVQQQQSRKVFCWGSNKYGQLIPSQTLCGNLLPTLTSLILSEQDQLKPSSYFTLFLTKNQTVKFNIAPTTVVQDTQTISLKQYKKLLNDFQLLKALNISLLQRCQPVKKQSKQVQTSSKFQISGVTQHRKFNSNIQINWKQIQLQSQINEGGYGVIFKAKWRQILVVVKKFKIQNGDVSLRDFLSQCHAMEAVRHPNIVMFLGAVTAHPHYSILLEYCSKGSLWSYLQNKQNNITWQDRRRLSIQIAQGVHYLHSCTPPILHRDLKSLNIFLDINLRIKIGDFGWTKTLEEYMTNKIGTYQWMAPQVIGSKPYTQKADIFSYSIIMWEIASREPPYRNINGTKVSQQVLNRQLRPTIPQKCPQAYSKLMKRCWQSDPSKRPSFKQIIRQLQVMKLS